MRARIYKPARNVMQSGTAKTRQWVLEYELADEREIDPLMGWTSSDDTQQQVCLRFDTLEQAEEYARERGVNYVVQPSYSRPVIVRERGYGENFSSARKAPWTH